VATVTLCRAPASLGGAPLLKPRASRADGRDVRPGSLVASLVPLLLAAAILAALLVLRGNADRARAGDGRGTAAAALSAETTP
jgi:hypothetical protein